MEQLNLIQQIIVWTLPVLFAVTVHEVAHGWVANRLGDSTARMLGRLTLNPIKHIDPIGTILVPGIFILLNATMGGGGVIFGWAKPVPVNWRNLKKPRRDTAIVAAAGPSVNLVMAFLWAGVAKGGILLLQQGFVQAKLLKYMGAAGIQINLMLLVLNLIPIPPLDGSRVVSSILPPTTARRYGAIEPYGFMILLALIFTGILSYILYPPFIFLFQWILSLFNMG